MHALLILVIASVTFIFTFPFSYADKLKMPPSILQFVCVFVSMELHILCCKEIYLSGDLIAGFFFFFYLADINKTNSLCFPFTFKKKKKKVILLLLMNTINGVFRPSI